jgi:hypothetical protein
MAAAQVLKATYAVDDAGAVRGVADIALSVDNRVAGVGDQVQGVSDQLKGIDDMVAVVRDGAQYTFNQSSKNCLIPNVHRWKCGQDNYATNSRWRRSDGTFVVFELHSCCTCRLNYRHQGINYDRIFMDGSRHRIHPRVTTLHIAPITRERRPGFLMATHIRNGSQ